MPNETFAWLSSIKDVEREFSVVRFATERLLVDASRDPVILLREMRPRDVRDATERLHGTYLIRMFAEFETGLRIFWSVVRNDRPPTRTRDLLESIAARRLVGADEARNAHAVREYRNMLVHWRDQTAEPLTMHDARRYLCVFFSRLPATW